MIIEIEEAKDTDIWKKQLPKKNERRSVYNSYSDKDQRRYVFFIQQKLVIPSQAANLHYKTARKWKTAGHYVQFISDRLDIMDKFPNMKGFHIVMGQCPN